MLCTLAHIDGEVTETISSQAEVATVACKAVPWVAEDAEVALLLTRLKCGVTLLLL